MNVYLICPVRNVSPDDKHRATEYVATLERGGHRVHYPPRDVDQSDDCGLAICEAHRDAMLVADEVHVLWNPASNGSHFDFGMAFMLAAMKPIRFKVVGRLDKSSGKSYANVLLSISDRNLLPRILTALAPAVKPFEWFECNGGNSWYAKTPFGDYTINREDAPYGGVVRYKWHVCFDEDHDEHEGEAPTLEAAQSAAWAHWCERIGGVLTTKGSDDE